jgi:predicted hydrocarbon binding protein
MCNGAGIFNQFKSMAGLDYASLSDNLTREILVIALDSPESFDAIASLYEAGKCAAEAGIESGVLEQDETTDTPDQGNQEDWEVFQSDVPEVDGEVAAETANKLAECASNINRYEVGKIGGKLFAKFFDNELKPEI